MRQPAPAGSKNIIESYLLLGRDYARSSTCASGARDWLGHSPWKNEKAKDKTMNMNRKVYTVGAGLMAACMAAATASAQTYMVFEYGASAGAVSQVSVANLAPNWVATGVRNSAGDSRTDHMGI